MNSEKTLLESCKILICTHVYPPDRGGIAAFTRDLYELFKNAGSRIAIFKGEKGGQGSGRLGSYLNLGKQFAELLKTIKELRPDVVFCSRVLPMGPLALLWSSVFRYKVVIQVHGTELRQRFNKGLRKKILTRMYNSADQLWANSEYTAGLLEDFGCDPDRIEIIYPFLTNDAQELAEQIDKNSRDQRPVLFTAATLYPRKGIDLVLKSLANLKELDWEYRIAGEPNHEKYEGFYEKIARDLGISDRVKFLGQLDRSKLWAEMARSTLYVMPSRGFENDIESFGIVFIEAQQFGVPCIGTNVGGIKEAIGDGGIIVKDEDTAELTRSIKYLITDREERNRLSSYSFNRIRREFSEQSRQDDIEEAFVRLLKDQI